MESKMSRVFDFRKKSDKLLPSNGAEYLLPTYANQGNNFSQLTVITFRFTRVFSARLRASASPRHFSPVLALLDPIAVVVAGIGSIA